MSEERGGFGRGRGRGRGGRGRGRGRGPTVTDTTGDEQTGDEMFKRHMEVEESNFVFEWEDEKIDVSTIAEVDKAKKENEGHGSLRQLAGNEHSTFGQGSQSLPGQAAVPVAALVAGVALAAYKMKPTKHEDKCKPDGAHEIERANLSNV